MTQWPYQSNSFEGLTVHLYLVDGSGMTGRVTHRDDHGIYFIDRTNSPGWVPYSSVLYLEVSKFQEEVASET